MTVLFCLTDKRLDLVFEEYTRGHYGYKEVDILSCNSMIFRKAYDSGNKCVNVNLVQDLLLPLAMHLGLLKTRRQDRKSTLVIGTEPLLLYNSIFRFLFVIPNMHHFGYARLFS